MLNASQFTHWPGTLGRVGCACYLAGAILARRAGRLARERVVREATERHRTTADSVPVAADAELELNPQHPGYLSALQDGMLRLRQRLEKRGLWEDRVIGDAITRGRAARTACMLGIPVVVGLAAFSGIIQAVLAGATLLTLGGRRSRWSRPGNGEA